MLMNKDDSILLIIDVQENLAPAQESPREVINGCASLLNVAEKLNIPYLIAEQDRGVFGPTMIDLRNVLGENARHFEKDTLSCYKNDAIREAVISSGKKQLIIAGLETHLCILQTALDFAGNGFQVFVVGDSCSSRNGTQSIMGVQRLLHNGVDVVTREMVLFEWIDKSGSDLFNELWERRP